MAMAMDAAKVTGYRRHEDEDGRDGDAADEHAEGESEREDVEGARFGNALGDEMAGEPVPHADFAGDVEKQEELRAGRAGGGRGRCRHRQGQSRRLRAGRASW